ncbi:hypothetical protein FUAX_51080 (plasmid) [Fulvitalea axinellae]|uniref:Porin n=1 Tax=Fulvitalea axinellae TaxID=1182444 RepID=A0AAU9CUH0_9BACT|nr:hypothetical protein FUAX_51080 [Fulvitalea axinellae]
MKARATFLILVLTFVVGGEMFGQTVSDSVIIDPTAVHIKPGHIAKDSMTQELEPLGIPKDRGLYLSTRDRLMQLHILGSVRFLALYDNELLDRKNAFNTYEIPVDNHKSRIPNYYSSLDQSRISFEVTRKTSGGNVFIRLESDFAGSNGYRIRHAYASFGNFLVGQTWSLFSNVSSLPLTVDTNGPSGAAKVRTPQIRFRLPIDSKNTFYAALEYSVTEVEAVDTTGLEVIELNPDLTVRWDRVFDFGKIQFSGMFTTVATKDADRNVRASIVVGGGFFGTVNINEFAKIDFQIAYGNAIARYVNVLDGQNLDTTYDPVEKKYKPLVSYGGFISYGYKWSKRINTSLSLGLAGVDVKKYQPSDAFRRSYSLSGDVFWKVVKGSRIGVEYSYGRRQDANNDAGDASRIAALFYYDF